MKIKIYGKLQNKEDTEIIRKKPVDPYISAERRSSLKKAYISRKNEYDLLIEKYKVSMSPAGRKAASGQIRRLRKSVKEAYDNYISYTGRESVSMKNPNSGIYGDSITADLPAAVTTEYVNTLKTSTDDFSDMENIKAESENLINSFISSNSDTDSIAETSVSPLSVAEYSKDTSTDSAAQTKSWIYGNAPFDARLIRSDAFLNNGEVMPFSAANTASIFSDMVEIAVDSSSNSGKHSGHLLPRNSQEAKRLAHNINLYGTQAIMNPYSVVRLYNGLTSVKQYNSKYLAGDHRMLDIRDNRRFYDIYSRNGKGMVTSGGKPDILSVSNPTVTNIIDIMCKDRWGRTPYSYQDFVFCKYFGRIPNNRLITLRKYLAPVYDNICWEEMQLDKNKISGSFAPVATMVTYFGGESGNSLKDIFNITSGVKWGTVKSEIHDVTGDTGTPVGQVDEEQMSSMGNLNYIPGYEGLTSVSSNVLSLMKFFGMARSPNAFNINQALAEKNIESLQDPNENGPYSNRIQGPLNRIDEVMKRDAGITFSNDITLNFDYTARPIGGMNTKAVMLDILSNVLLMCSATAVFWGGGYRFQIQPHGYAWNSVWGGKGIMKKMYNGDILGSNGVIADWIGGLTHFSGASGNTWWEKVISAFGSLGAGFLGSLGALADGLVSTLTGQANQMTSELLSGVSFGGNTAGSNSAFGKAKTAFGNIMSNAKSAWRANSVKETTLPYIGGMKALLIGTPVGNWHLTVGNPLNPIAVIGNLCCEDVQFHFGEELGPDDFPTELHCTIKLKHGMARDLASIESMFNRGAGRIYQIPDYIRMYGKQPSSDEETKVDDFTGGTAFRVPMNWTRFTGHASGYGTYSVSSGKANSMAGSWNQNIALPVEKTEILDYDYGQFSAKYTSKDSSTYTGYRSMFIGNMAARKLAEG